MAAGDGTRKRAGKAARPIPREVREAVLARLEPEQRRYVESGDVASFAFSFRGGYLYVASRSPAGPWGGARTPQPMCRLRYTGDIENWAFELWRYSQRGYDEAQEFPFLGGTPERCFAVAADFYVWEFDALSAGSSVGTHRRPRRIDEPFGLAWMLPRLSGGEAPPHPELPPSALAVAECDLVADFTSFLRFVEGRTFDLAPRAFGFRRSELREVNARLRHPRPVGERPVQDMLPQIQCCFSIAEALGLLDVSRTLHRAAGTDRIGGFLERPAAHRWWDILEALWHRVSWSSLRAGARGSADAHQAARWWLGLELSRRVAPIVFDWRIAFHGEVLESLLFPCWRDASLVTLQHDETMRAAEPNLRVYGRWTCLRKVEVTDAGRWAFSALAASSPRDPEVMHDHPAPEDGRWDGTQLLERLGRMAPPVGPVRDEGENSDDDRDVDPPRRARR
jgi:hypothetical protein